MTAELLEPMSYEERCAIHIDMNTVMTKLNIFSCVRGLSDIVVATPPILLMKLGLCRSEPLWTPRLLRFIYQTEVLTSLLGSGIPGGISGRTSTAVEKEKPKGSHSILFIIFILS